MAATAFQNIVQERQKKLSLKLNASLHQAKEHPRDFFWGGFFELRKKNEQARIEIIVFIQSIELQQMEPLT